MPCDAPTKKKIRFHRAGAELKNQDLIKQMLRVQNSLLEPPSMDLDIVISGMTPRNLFLAGSASGDTACVEDLAGLQASQSISNIFQFPDGSRGTPAEFAFSEGIAGSAGRAVPIVPLG